jgi:hypothetical protein
VTAWIEASGFSIWMRESPSFLAFPLMLSLHAIGMGLAAGINGALALRLLGVAPDVPVSEMKRFFPAMWAGVWVNGLSGVALLIAYPTKALTNPVFYVKLALVALALAISKSTGRRVFGQPAARDAERTRTARRLAVASLAVWISAITAGRLLAYTYTHILAAR